MGVLPTLQRADLQLFHWFFQLGGRGPITTLARVFSRSGDGQLLLVVPLLMFLVGSPSVGLLFAALALGLAIERPLYWVLKNGFKRYRPADKVPGFRSLIVPSDQFSFPSGHSSAAFLLAVTAGLIFGGLAWWLLPWATGVALSRVVLGVHFPGDTLAGAAMGTGIAACTVSWLSVLPL